MTYQELLEKFNSRRAINLGVTTIEGRFLADIDVLMWAVQSLIEMQRDAEQRVDAVVRNIQNDPIQGAGPTILPIWKDR